MEWFNYGYYKRFGRYGGKLVLFKGNCLKPRGRRNGLRGDSVEKSDRKELSNISRARSRVIELGLSNPWEFFVTLTLDPRKWDRTDLPMFNKSFAQWLRNERKAGRCDVKYLLIPELHADGVSWHMHGMLYGLPLDQLEINKNGYLDWPRYREKFGYCSIDYIRDIRKTCSYLTKYVSKQLGQSIAVSRHCFYASQGLQGGQIIHEGQFVAVERHPDDFDNDFVRVRYDMEGKIPPGFLNNRLDNLPESWYNMSERESE